MRPIDEYHYLKGFSETSPKLLQLGEFLRDRDKVLLLDADSLLFNVAHFNYETEFTDDLEKQYEDYLSQVRQIANRIEEDGYSLNIIHFFTTCKKNFRYEIYKDYKANRERTPLGMHVSLLKHYVIQMLESEGVEVRYSDTLEADDMIGEGVELLGLNSIVCSIDKDLRQLPTAHFDYYRVKVGEDENGVIKDYRGWSFVSEEEAVYNLHKQLLVGDTSDNIKGVKGVGDKTADKLLKDKSEFQQLLTVARAYGDMERLRTNVKLMRL